jgi:hypothetical protein
MKALVVESIAFWRDPLNHSFSPRELCTICTTKSVGKLVHELLGAAF